MNPFLLPPETTLGPVRLITADLPRALDFYQSVIGLQLLGQTDQRAWLGIDETLLNLTAAPHAQPKPPRTSGLYHFAILVPGRLDLARSLRHLMEIGYPLQGASDHLVSEALYLADPDGNGIEIYADRPRDAWRTRNGQLEIATLPLDANGLLAELDGDGDSWGGLPVQTRIGHIHLHVADLAQTEAFYRDVLGFDLVARYGPSASFVAAGGYHHHIGMNTWIGAGAPPPPAGTVGLEQFTIQLPDKGALLALRDHLHRAEVPIEEVVAGLSLRDPTNNGILLTAEPAATQSGSSSVQTDFQ